MGKGNRFPNPGPPVMPSSLESLMKRTRRTRTTVEQREVVIIRNLRKQGFCAGCSEQTALISVEEGVRISGLSSRAVYRLIEAGRIHFAETAEGSVLICPATLLVSNSW